MHIRQLLVALLYVSGGLQAAPVPIVTEHFPPYQHEEAGQPLQGWSVDIITQLFSQAGLDYRIDVMPWARAFKTTQDQPGTLIFSLLRTPARENQFAWIAPLCPLRVSFYTASDRQDIELQSLEDALHYRVGTETGQANHRFLLELGFKENRNLMVVGHNHQLRQMLAMQRIDLILVSDLYVSQLADGGQALRKLLPVPVLDRYLYLAGHPATDPQLLARLRQAWQQLAATARPACQSALLPPAD